MFSVGTIQFNQNHRMIKVEASNYSEFAKTCLENFVKSHKLIFGWFKLHGTTVHEHLLESQFPAGSDNLERR